MAATELATAYVSLVPSLRGAGGAIGKELGGVNLDGAGRDMGKSLSGGMLGSVKSLVGPAIAVLGSGMFAGFIAEAAKASDATDKFKATMSFAGLDTSAITKATAASKAYADQTVYDLPTIQQTMAQLASNGVKNYTDITKAAGNLNAVAGGNAETFKSVSRTLTQSAGAGKLMTEDWNMLADAIPGASGPLQKALIDAGAYTGNFKEAMSKGQITSEEFQAALLKLGNQPVAVEAAKSTKTFEGALGNLEATINSGLMGALDAVKPQLTGMINGVAAGIGGAFTFVGDAIGGFKSLIMDGDITPQLLHALGVEEDSPVIGGLLFLQDTFWAVFRGIRDFITGFTIPRILDPEAMGLTGFAAVGASVRGVFDGIWAAIGPLIPQVLDLYTSLSPLNLIFQSLQPFLPLIADTFLQLAGTIGGSLVTAITGLLPSFQGLAGVMVNLFQTVLAVALPTVVQLVTMLGATFAQLLPIVIPIIAQVAMLAATLITQLAPIFMQLVTAVMPMVVTILGAVLQAIAPLISTIASVLIPVISALLPVVVTVFSIISSVITNVMQIIMGIIQVVTGIISGNWAQVWSGILNVVSGVFGLILSVVSGAIQFVISIVSGGLNAVFGFFSSVFANIVGYVSRSFLSIVNGASGMLGDLLGFFGGIGGKILGALGDVGSTLFNAGKNIVQGLIDGIGSMLGAIGRAVLNIVPEAIRGPFEQLMGIHSPSLVAKGWGHHIGAGLVIGLEDSYDPVAEATALLVRPPDFPDLGPGGGAYAALEPAYAMAGDGKPTLVQNVYPREGQSEESIAEASARKIMRRSR